MSTCPTCQFLISDGTEGCEFCDGTAHDTDPSEGTPFLTGQPFDENDLAGAESADSSRRALALADVDRHPAATFSRSAVSTAVVPTGSPGATTGLVFPAPYPEPLGTKATGLFEFSANRAEPTPVIDPIGVTVTTRPSTLLIAIFLLVGLALLGVGTLLLAAAI
ncbi:MAG TPA: hypothetical protein PLV93_00515 [Microthrixaceae bacterium]|nr:hypothetical protein [Microthrixaceae bacterium]HNI33844.1 hypothetical protein [Microthrixaceae bacterium]